MMNTEHTTITELRDALEVLISVARRSQQHAPPYGPQWNFYEGQIHGYQYTLDWLDMWGTTGKRLPVPDVGIVIA